MNYEPFMQFCAAVLAGCASMIFVTLTLFIVVKLTKALLEK